MEVTQFHDFEKIISAIPANVYWLDKNLVCQGCNDMQAKAIGLKSRHDVVGKIIKDLFLDPTIVDNINRNNLKVINTGEPCIFEESVVSNDGSILVMLSHKIPLIEQGEIIGLLGISVDITKKNILIEKTKRERDEYFIALENIIANLPGHVYWQDRNNIFLGCNELQAKAAGLKSSFEIIGKSNYDLPWKKQAEELNKINNEVMETGKEYSIEEWGELYDGKRATFISKKSPMRNSKGEIIGIIGISFDITERKMMEQELIQAKEEAEIANNSKTEFLQNMRHDFRTPFCGILGMANILYESETDNDKKEKLSNIVKSSQVLLEQLNEITDFISLENGNLPIIEKQFNLSKIITDVENLHLPAAQAKQLKLIIEIDSQIPKYNIRNMIRTQRILIKMQTNTIK